MGLVPASVRAAGYPAAFWLGPPSLLLPVAGESPGDFSVAGRDWNTPLRELQGCPGQTSRVVGRVAELSANARAAVRMAIYHAVELLIGP
jgi:hypothetical protein